MRPPLVELVRRRAGGIRLFGHAPPRRDTDAARVAELAALQRGRLAALGPDGVIVYDIHDEGERTAAPRPFPFLPTLDPATWADVHLAGLAAPRVVYRSTAGLDPADLGPWLRGRSAAGSPLAVLVGAPSARAAGRLSLPDAYAVARREAPEVLLGGVAIAERHARRLDEHERLAAKLSQGCRFFVTQAVYDPSSTRSLLSDYALRLARDGTPPAPILLTFSPCGSVRTFEFMRWLGISFPRWVENELRHSPDFLERSVRLCDEILADVLGFAREKGVPVGINVESVSVRKAEIEAALELFRILSRRLDRDA
jgi:hypothetical protein